MKIDLVWVNLKVPRGECFTTHGTIIQNLMVFLEYLLNNIVVVALTLNINYLQFVVYLKDDYHIF